VTRALEALGRGAAALLGRPLADHENANFVKYMDLLRKWQKTQRLVGSVEPMWIVEHLLLDSLLFLKVLPSTARTLLDLGSGAGLPGIPIRIVRSDLDVTLAESSRRRASFLAAVVRELRLGQLRVISARLEDQEDEPEARFDAVVMRCAGPVDELIPVAEKYAVTGGVVIASGPPESHHLSRGEWVVVPGLGPGKSRRFVVVNIS
jgi:16S rRNA (guanine527-N7)-methyltransferase